MAVARSVSDKENDCRMKVKGKKTGYTRDLHGQ